MGRGSLPPLEDDFSRALLGSAEADEPSNAAYAKAAAALGIGVGLGIGASLPASATVAAGVAGVAGIARWSSSLGAKLLALGVSGALLAGAGALLLRGPDRAEPIAQPRRVAAAHPAATEPARAVTTSPSTDREPSAAPPPVSLPGVPAKSGEPPLRSNAVRPAAAARSAGRVAPAKPAFGASTASTSIARISSSASLAEQVQSLDRARVALGSGDSAAALRELRHYRAAWPKGVFLTEASMLEIEALAARGDRSLTARRAADFVAAHPDSPHADRLRALIPQKTH